MSQYFLKTYTIIKIIMDSDGKFKTLVKETFLVTQVKASGTVISGKLEES